MRRRKLINRELFRPIHPPNTLEKNLGPEQYKGVIDPVEAAKVCLTIHLISDGGMGSGVARLREGSGDQEETPNQAG